MPRKKILIIDDDRVFLQIMSQRISAAGYDVLTALDGIQGIRLAHNEQPHLIILDIKFPAGGGIDTLRKLNLSIRTSKIPVIICTGFDDPQWKQLTLGFNVIDYMVKPVNPEKLIERIDETLKNLL